MTTLTRVSPFPYAKTCDGNRYPYGDPTDSLHSRFCLHLEMTYRNDNVKLPTQVMIHSSFSYFAILSATPLEKSLREDLQPFPPPLFRLFAGPPFTCVASLFHAPHSALVPPGKVSYTFPAEGYILVLMLTISKVASRLVVTRRQPPTKPRQYFPFPPQTVLFVKAPRQHFSPYSLDVCAVPLSHPLPSQFFPPSRLGRRRGTSCPLGFCYSSALFDSFLNFLLAFYGP